MKLYRAAVIIGNAKNYILAFKICQSIENRLVHSNKAVSKLYIIIFTAQETSCMQVHIHNYNIACNIDVKVSVHVASYTLYKTIF